MDNQKLLNTALILSFITIFYNVIEGIISVYFGIEDETLSLLGFGTDSFVEVISGIGIAHMVFRMKSSKIEKRDKFERQALRITGTGFYILTAGIIVGAIITIIGKNKPETTIPGLIIAGISILTMFSLMRYNC
jgi:divalent metal cation (Fe/Co/Zn/Cd) transporter